MVAVRTTELINGAAAEAFAQLARTTDKFERYENPHAQRIIEGMMNGAKLAVMDTRLSNTASMADYWMATYPGTEAAV